MNKIAAKQSLRIAAPPARAFALAAGAAHAGEIFKKSGLLPGVADIEGHEAPWSEAGQQRRLTLTDGGALTEDLIAVEEGACFVYRASRFSGVFGQLVSEARGEFRFVAAGGETLATWSYAFTPASAGARAPVWFIAGALWPGYMRSALRRLKAIAEAAP